MQLEGIHHITAITGDAPRNLDFYVRVLGLRLVKKTVNQDQPSVYHLFYGDDEGSPGHDLTFFDYPGAGPGRPGAGMVHTIGVRVGTPDALGYWRDRLGDEGIAAELEGGRMHFADPEGLRFELVTEDVPDQPLAASSDVPADYRLQGFAGVRAYSDAPERSRHLLERALRFRPAGSDRWEARGRERGSWVAYDSPPAQPGLQRAGSVHHVAWATREDDQLLWRQRVINAGARPTPVIDRYYFQSVYFREPSGVLFELATIGPGFTIDEPLEHLGEQLSLPPFLEDKRTLIEATLRPLPTPQRTTTAAR